MEEHDRAGRGAKGQGGRVETRLSKGEKRMWRMKRGLNERGRGRVRGWKRKEGSTRYNKGARARLRARGL